MFKSKTKPDAKIVPFSELERIRKAVDLPIVLIGGINKNTIPNFEKIDIAGYAMITPIVSQTDIKKALCNLLEIINKNKNNFIKIKNKV